MMNRKWVSGKVQQENAPFPGGFFSPCAGTGAAASAVICRAEICSLDCQGSSPARPHLAFPVRAPFTLLLRQEAELDSGGGAWTPDLIEDQLKQVRGQKPFPIRRTHQCAMSVYQCHGNAQKLPPALSMATLDHPEVTSLILDISAWTTPYFACN